MKKTKIKIKKIYTGKVLFECEKNDNTIKDTVIEALKNGVSLRNADLRDADLSDADLRYADLSGADLRNADLRGANLGDASLRNADLRGASLRYADLSSADLSDVGLSGADLDSANLSGANLSGANISDAYLRNADLRDADLRSTNLSGANISDADLRNASLSYADLRDASLSYAILRDADLRDAKNIPYIPLACPSDGAFIGWKKVGGKYLVKLLILEDAKRSSSTNRKCRCSKAQVLSITTLDEKKHFTEVTNTAYKPYITYKVGEVVLPDSFDENRWNECSHGIHFFINKQDAIDYWVY